MRFRAALLLIVGMCWGASSRAEPENIAAPTVSALDFDGVQSYVDISRAATTLGDFTIAGWYKIRNKGSLQFLFRMTNDERSTRRLQIAESGGLIIADMRARPGGMIDSVSSSNFIYNAWLHIALVRKSDQLTLYFNGKRVGTSAASADLMEVNRWAFLGANTYRNSDFRFGHPENYLDGSIDEVQIWTVAREPEEISETMSGIVGPRKGLHAYWRFDDRRGTRLADCSGHDFDGVVANARWTLHFFEVTSLEPRDGKMFSNPGEGLRFSVYSGEGNIPASNITLVLNGKKRSSGLRITGTEHERYVEFAPLEVDQFYKAEIMVTDSRGRRLDRSVSFNTFRPNEYRRRALRIGSTIGGACFLLAAGWVIAVRLGRRRELQALRSRLARDIHDEIGSNLAGIAVLSEAARESSGTVAEQQEDWDEINGVARRTMESMREVLWLVADTEEIEFDLVKHMALAARRMLCGKEIQWESLIDQPLPDWRLEDRRQVFLFFKEAVTNILRHAVATRVVFSMRIARGTFHLQIADNGRGFDPLQIKPGIGVNSQKTRIESLHGVMNVLSQPGKGTVVTIQVPIRKTRKAWRLGSRLSGPQKLKNTLTTTEP